MRWVGIITSALLLACNPAPGDGGGQGDTTAPGDSDVAAGDEILLGDEEPPWLALEVGEVGEMSNDATGVWADLAQPGTYIMILISRATDQGTLYGYGPGLDKSKRTDPPDTPPDDKWPPPEPNGKTEVGDQRFFDVFNGSITTTITAEAIRVTDGVVLWEDLTTPNPLTASEMVDMMANIDQALTDFEAIVMPREEQIFGVLSDVDADGQVAVLLSYTVNQYDAEAYVTSCDIGVTEGCGATNNGGEIIYFGIPDPEESSSSASGITETLAHELNHLIYGHHKIVLNELAVGEENIYVTEGMAALAQDLTGYNNGNQYVWAAAIGSEYYGSDDYSVQALSVNDLLRGNSYYDTDRDGALRGGGYLLMRYLFEQAGGMQVAWDGALLERGGMAWVQSWFQSPELGVAALEATTGRDLWSVTLDWYTALVVTGRGINDEPAFNYEERVEDPITGYRFGFDPFATIHGWLTLNGPPIQPWDSPDGDLRAGGVEYLLIEAPVGRLSLEVDLEALPRARLFRVE